MLAGSMTVASAGICQQYFTMPPAARRPLLRDRLSVSDVPAYYHATTAGGDFFAGEWVGA